MVKKSSKSKSKEKIDKFFGDIESKSAKEVKKIKKEAMGHKINLKDKRKLFCKKCLNPYKNSSIKIKNKVKKIICKNCGYENKWKIK